jgi:ABC-2 type transport system permease protein
LSRIRAIWLVAKRELLERGRSKGFIGSLIITEVFVVGSFLLQAALATGESRVDIGYVGQPPAGLEERMDQIATLNGRSVAVTTFADRASAEAALGTEQVEAVLLPGATEGDPGTLLFQAEPGSGVETIVQGALVQLQLEAAGANVLPPATESIEPVSKRDETAFLLANIGVIFLFISIFSYGYWVLSGVVEEKQSRVVEVVLSTVRPRDLLMGKVFGIGILGLVQLLILLLTGLIAANFVGSVELPDTTIPTVVQLVVWFVLGYVLYSTLFGVLGALASRMEEASNVTTPVSFLAMGAYFLSIFVVLNEPDGLVARIASLIPPAAPMVVPMRAAFGAIEWWEVLLSIAVTVLFVYFLFVLGGRIYTGAVLQTGGRMKLRDAWRSAR